MITDTYHRTSLTPYEYRDPKTGLKVRLSRKALRTLAPDLEKQWRATGTLRRRALKAQRGARRRSNWLRKLERALQGRRPKKPAPMPVPQAVERKKNLLDRARSWMGRLRRGA